MSDIPVTESIGKARWRQGGDGEHSLEIRIPLTLPDGVRPRNLTVEVKDSSVLCVSHHDTRLLQWRLYAAVGGDVEWRVEHDNELVVELDKKTGNAWDCLLNLPMRNDDALLTSTSDIDRLFAEQLPSLPPVGSAEEARILASSAAAAAAADTTAKKSDDDKATHTEASNGATAAATTTDLDQLLEEAAAEVTGGGSSSNNKTSNDNGTAADKTANDTPKLQTAEDIAAAFVKAELENYRVEEREIRKKLAEVTARKPASEAGSVVVGEGAAEEAATATTTTSSTDEATTAAGEVADEKQQAILDAMLRLHDTMRELRTQPSSLARFLQYTRLDLRKARANIGHLDEAEDEDYADADERAMSATELMARGMQAFEARDLARCLHLLRLAAIHHKHDQSIVVLYTICSQLGSPVATALLLERALDDAAPSAVASFRVGELYDQGARHFLPLFPAAVFFYERAARLGSVNAMLALAQLWQRGATSSSMLTDAQADAQRDMRKYHAWLDKAIDRGCGAAYFVKGCMYLNGEHGLPQSYALAKANLDAAMDTKRDIIQQMPMLPKMLEELRQREEQPQQDKATTKTATAAAAAAVAPLTTASVSTAAAATTTTATSPKLREEPATTSASVARLNALSRAAALRDGATAAAAGGAAAGVARTRKLAGASSSSWWACDRRAFWERTCVTGLVLYGAYTLLFPVRVLLLPTFYNFVSNLIDAVPWLANRSNGNANLFL